MIASTVRLALWATARVDRSGPGERPWRIVDDASNPIDAQACTLGGRTVLARGALDRSVRGVGAVPTATEPLCFTDRANAEARLHYERRKAAWLALFELRRRLGNELDRSYPLRQLYASLAEEEPDPVERRHLALARRRAGERGDHLLLLASEPGPAPVHSPPSGDPPPVPVRPGPARSDEPSDRQLGASEVEQAPAVAWLDGHQLERRIRRRRWRR